MITAPMTIEVAEALNYGKPVHPFSYITFFPPFNNTIHSLRPCCLVLPCKHPRFPHIELDINVPGPGVKKKDGKQRKERFCGVAIKGRVADWSYDLGLVLWPWIGPMTLDWSYDLGLVLWPWINFRKWCSGPRSDSLKMNKARKGLV